MFRITEDPSSGSLVQCLAKNYKNDSNVSVDMDKVGVMAAYSICWSTFKYFIILIVSTYYILCISWIIMCLIVIDTRCKHEERSEPIFLNIEMSKKKSLKFELFCFPIPKWVAGNSL